MYGGSTSLVSVLQSTLLLLAWGTTALFGSRFIRMSRLRAILVSVLALSVLVELAAAVGAEALITRNLGLVAVILLVLLTVVSHMMNHERQDEHYGFGSQAPQIRWGVVLVMPLIVFLCLRWFDTKGIASSFDVDLDSFRGAEDNSKWLGAASALRIGVSPGVESIGGALVVLLRGAIAIGDWLSFLGVKMLSSELATVTFAVQFCREILIVASPLIFLFAAPKAAPLSRRVLAIGPAVALSLITQSAAFEFGFLSFQVALALGTCWVIMRFRTTDTRASDEFLVVLVGVVFLLSWLPLRLILPFFVATSVSFAGKRNALMVRIMLTLLSMIVALPTYRYVFGLHPGSSRGLDYAVSLVAAGGGVFSISQWLVAFAFAICAIATSTRNTGLTFPTVSRMLLGYVVVVLLVDLMLSGRLGYGSTKLLFLTLCLMSVWASVIIGGSRQSLSKSAAFLVVTTLFMVISSYGGISPWTPHLRSLISSTEQAPNVYSQAQRVNDPQLVLYDYGRLKTVLKEVNICTDERCDLSDIPRVCLTIYSNTRKQLMQSRVVTQVDALASGDIHEYICTRFLTEISQGNESKSVLQSNFFFKYGERLRDSLTKLAASSPETRILVAIEGKSKLEIRTATELRTIAWQIFPLVESCQQLKNLRSPNNNCLR